MIAGLRRVLLLNGVVRSADAISRSLLLKREALEGAFGNNVRVDIAAYAIDGDIPNAQRVQGIAELMGLEAFQRADLLIYEFGIFYDLFGSVRFAPPQARRIAVWHNVTPPEFAANSAGRTLMKRSLDQKSNMLHCDHILCDSHFNAAELDDLDFDPDRVSVLNLPVSARLLQLGVKQRRVLGSPLRLIFIGRFVPSKGVLDLVCALGQAVHRVPCDVQLALVGNIDLSDPYYLGKLNKLIAASPADIRFCGTLDEAGLAAALHEADIFVMPSYHEGYCLPVIEAFAAGCHVISYDAGNLPAIVGVYGAIVRTGDVDGLADALCECFAEHRAADAEHREPAFRTGDGRIPETQRRQNVRRYAAGFSEAVYAEGFLMEIEKMFTRKRITTGAIA
jgi:glycosyltransferase involved in cell wall biosynthesis